MRLNIHYLPQCSARSTPHLTAAALPFSVLVMGHLCELCMPVMFQHAQESALQSKNFRQELHTLTYDRLGHNTRVSKFG